MWNSFEMMLGLMTYYIGVPDVWEGKYTEWGPPGQSTLFAHVHFHLQVLLPFQYLCIN